jgi:nucleotide-binding universal stress UspA family protein
MTTDHPQGEQQEPQVRRIVAGIDGSPASIEALAWAARQADLTDSALEVIMTWDWPTTYGAAFAFPSDYDPSENVKTVVEEAKAALQQSYPTVAISVVVAEGHPAPFLVEASKGADLLVVGSRGHGEFVGMLIGSVSEFCSTHAHCPVLLHRPAS